MGRSKEVDKLFYELMVRLKDCSYEEAGVKLQVRLCYWLADQGESEAADWFAGLVSDGAGLSREGSC